MKKVELKSIMGLDFGTLFYITVNPRAKSVYEAKGNSILLSKDQIRGVYHKKNILWEDGSISDTEGVESAIKAKWLNAYIEERG